MKLGLLLPPPTSLVQWLLLKRDKLPALLIPCSSMLQEIDFRQLWLRGLRHSSSAHPICRLEALTQLQHLTMFGSDWPCTSWLIRRSFHAGRCELRPGATILAQCPAHKAEVSLQKRWALTSRAVVQMSYPRGEVR